jgi:hypothetical protein
MLLIFAFTSFTRDKLYSTQPDGTIVPLDQWKNQIENYTFSTATPLSPPRSRPATIEIW